MSLCNGTPLSWLRLERYVAGDVEDAERSVIAAHLAGCPACRGAADMITNDRRSLPALPARPKSLARVLKIATGVALAASLAFVVGRSPRKEELGDGVKGQGDGQGIGFVLVRDDESVVADAAGTYNDGDRWKVLVTCPPGMRTTFDVAVYENGDPSFPLEPIRDLACGNGVSLPGAFRVTGHTRLTVCLVWGDAPARPALRNGPSAASHCKVLEPAR